MLEVEESARGGVCQGRNRGGAGTAGEKQRGGGGKQLGEGDKQRGEGRGVGQERNRAEAGTGGKCESGAASCTGKNGRQCPRIYFFGEYTINSDIILSIEMRSSH